MAAISVPLHSEPNILWRLIGRPTSAIGIAVLVIIVLAAILAPVIAPYAPSKLSIASRLHPPARASVRHRPSFGRDVFTRMLYAARTSLSVGFAVVIFFVGHRHDPGTDRGLFQTPRHTFYRGWSMR